jgi:hypothetical protein
MKSGSLHATGDVRVAKPERRSVRYGIEFSNSPTPEAWRAPHFGDMRKYGGVFWSPFDVCIVWSRKDRFYPTSYMISFIDRPDGVNRDEWPQQEFINDRVLKFPPQATWTEKDITRLDTREVRKWGLNCVYYEIERLWPNVGNNGEINREFGLWFVHPADPDVVVVLWFLDRFAPRIGEAPDQRVDALAEAICESIEFVPLSNEDRSRMREVGWLVPW